MPCFDLTDPVASFSVRLILDGDLVAPCDVGGGGSSVGVGGRSTEGVPLLEPRNCDPHGVPLRAGLLMDPMGEVWPCCFTEALFTGVFSVL